MTRRTLTQCPICHESCEPDGEHVGTGSNDCRRCTVPGCGQVLHHEPNGDGTTFPAHANGAEFCNLAPKAPEFADADAAYLLRVLLGDLRLLRDIHVTTVAECDPGSGRRMWALGALSVLNQLDLTITNHRAIFAAQARRAS